MNLTKEQLKTISDLAYRLVTPALVAIAIEADEQDFIQEVRTPGTAAHQAYYQGYLQQQVELREALIKSSKNGSNPAQMELLKIIKQLSSSIHYE